MARSGMLGPAAPGTDRRRPQRKQYDEYRHRVSSVEYPVRKYSNGPMMPLRGPPPGRQSRLQSSDVEHSSLISTVMVGSGYRVARKTRQRRTHPVLMRTMPAWLQPGESTRRATSSRLQPLVGEDRIVHQQPEPAPGLGQLDRLHGQSAAEHGGRQQGTRCRPLLLVVQRPYEDHPTKNRRRVSYAPGHPILASTSWHSRARSRAPGPRVLPASRAAA